MTLKKKKKSPSHHPQLFKDNIYSTNYSIIHHLKIGDPYKHTRALDKNQLFQRIRFLWGRVTVPPPLPQASHPPARPPAGPSCTWYHGKNEMMDGWVDHVSLLFVVLFFYSNASCNTPNHTKSHRICTGDATWGCRQIRVDRRRS